MNLAKSIRVSIAFALSTAAVSFAAPPAENSPRLRELDFSPFQNAFAAQAGAPVVPVYIHGTDKVVDAPRTPVSVTFGRPIMISGRGSKAYRAGAEQIGAELRRLQAFAESADRAGRPKYAIPPEAPAETDGGQ